MRSYGVKMFLIAINGNIKNEKGIGFSRSSNVVSRV